MVYRNINKTVGMYFKASQLKSYCLILLGFAILLISGCKNKSNNNGDVVTQEKDSLVSDQPISEFQDALLEVAFETASLIPVNPHIKDRSKVQELVVEARLALDQPVKAMALARQVDNWRRGQCMADVAFYCVKKGDLATTKDYLTQAQKELEKLEEKLAVDEIDWRRDRIKLKIERVSALQKQQAQLEASPKNMLDTNSNQVPNRNTVSNDLFKKQTQVLDELIAAGGFDETRNALMSYAELYRRFYINSEYRASIENKVKASWEKLPFFIRVDILLEMAESALEHSELVDSLRLVNEAQVFIDGYQWPPEKRISMMSQLIPLRFLAGDVEKAKADAGSMLSLFDAKSDKIVDIYRAGALRKLAEAYQKIGDTQIALIVYKKAIEEGVANPNSRPRAEDLAATCCSMALNAVEPDTQLWARIHEIYEGLGQPW